MASAWGRSWGVAWGNSWGALLRHGSRPVPPFRGNPNAILDEIRRGKLIDRLVMIQLGIWEEDFLSFLLVFLSANAAWLLPDVHEIATAKVAERSEEMGREWFDRIMAGDARIEDMSTAPNPYVESYKADFARFRAVLH